VDNSQQRGKIIVFGNKKGGVGKSVSALNLAGVIANRGQTVCIVDADTNETANSYLRRRNNNSAKLEAAGKPPLAFIKSELKRPNDTLTRDLKELSNHYNYVIVDTGGYENNAFKTAVPIATVIYIPFRPSLVDVEQIVPTLTVIKQIESTLQSIQPEYAIDVRLMITNVESHSLDLFIEARKACESLLDFCSISSCMIKQVKAIGKLQNDGLTLTDVKHKSRSLFELLLDEIDGKRKVKLARKVVSDASDTTQAEA
jgi:cellulose biosynthesis protein BcsQ